MQSHNRAMEDLRKKMEAQLLMARQELEAATASNNALSGQLQALTQSMKEQCTVPVLA